MVFSQPGASLNVLVPLIGTHIPIVAPSESSPDYYNRKGFYSIVLQAVVDYHYRYSTNFIRVICKYIQNLLFDNSCNNGYYSDKTYVSN
jgi:hypothetical protein